MYTKGIIFAVACLGIIAFALGAVIVVVVGWSPTIMRILACMAALCATITIITLFSIITEEGRGIRRRRRVLKVQIANTGNSNYQNIQVGVRLTESEFHPVLRKPCTESMKAWLQEIGNPGAAIAYSFLEVPGIEEVYILRTSVGLLKQDSSEWHRLWEKVLPIIGGCLGKKRVEVTSTPWGDHFTVRCP